MLEKCGIFTYFISNSLPVKEEFTKIKSLHDVNKTFLIKNCYCIFDDCHFSNLHIQPIFLNQNLKIPKYLKYFDHKFIYNNSEFLTRIIQKTVWRWRTSWEQKARSRPIFGEISTARDKKVPWIVIRISNKNEPYGSMKL